MLRNFLKYIEKCFRKRYNRKNKSYDPTESVIMKKVTITDVAKAAQTSPTTVSRVLNNTEYPVSLELRERILNAARTLGYAQSVPSRKKSCAEQRDIGVIMPNITNLFYPQTVLGIEGAIADSGYNILLFNTLRNKKREQECLQLLFERQVKGVIISAVDNTIDNLGKYLNSGMKFVLLDQLVDDSNGCPSLNFDSRKGARMAIKHLVAKGHRRIAFATTPLTRWTRMETFKGYKEALALADIEFDEDLVFIASEEQEGISSNYEVDAGKRLAVEFHDKGGPATAILCVNDMVAFGVIKELADLGVQVPEDVSIIGFDDIPLSEVFIPSLTTIRYPAYDTGKLAAMLLLDNMSNNLNQLSINMKMDPQFVERRTVRDLNA